MAVSLGADLRRFVAQICYGAANEALRRKKHQAALRWIIRAVETSPEGREDPLFLSCLGRCYLHCSDHERAVRFLSEALARMDADRALWSRGVLMDEYRRVQDALAQSRAQGERGAV